MKTTPPPTRVAPASLRRFVALSASLGLTLGSVQAADIAWSPSLEGNTSWDNGSNWSGGSAPADNLTSDIAVFNGTTAYNFQPSLDAFTVRSVNGLRIGGASTVALTLGAATGTRTTSGATATNSDTVTLANVSGLAVGQHVTGARIPLGTFITEINGNTITLSRPTAGGTLNDATSLTFSSSLRLGSGGITLSADTPNVTNTITAPLVLGASQTWDAQAARSLAVQGSIYLDNHTLTLNGVAGSTISFNGNSGTQSIGGTGNIIVDTDGNVNFGPGSGGRQINSYSGGVTLNKGRITLNGGNSGGTGTMGGLGTGVLTINGGEIAGGGNIAGKPLTISGQVWNANWSFVSNRSVDMGTGQITLGTAAGTSRTVTTSASLPLILGGDLVNGTTANAFIKDGAGEIILNGDVLITGNTTVSAGTLTLGTTGSFTFYIGADGVNNMIDGLGTAAFNGTFNFDLTGAEAVAGASWQIVDLASLTATFSETFTVQSFSETVPDSGIWTFGDYTFSEATGLLTYAAIPEPSTYAALVGAGVLGLSIVRRRRSS